MNDKVFSEKIWGRKQAFDFELLLEPYREGGTEYSPIRRTMGTIVDYLLHKKKYPRDVVSTAIFKTFLELQNGLEFKGDGSYGSAGHELIYYIRTQCDALSYKQITDNDNEWVVRDVINAVAKWTAKETKRRMKPWFVRMFIRKPAIRIEH